MMTFMWFSDVYLMGKKSSERKAAHQVVFE